MCVDGTPDHDDNVDNEDDEDTEAADRSGDVDGDVDNVQNVVIVDNDAVVDPEHLDRYRKFNGEQRTKYHRLLTINKAPNKAALRAYNNGLAIMSKSLGPYQDAGVEFMVAREHNLDDSNVRGGFLADSVGNGKTYIALRTMVGDVNPETQKLGRSHVTKKTAVFVPHSVMHQWAAQFSTFVYERTDKADNMGDKFIETTFGMDPAKLKSNLMSSVVSHDLSSRVGYMMVVDNQRSWDLNQLPPTVGIVVMSHNLLQKSGKVPKWLYNTKWHRIVVDEAHVMVKSSGATYKNFVKLKSDIKWLISATPMQNNVKDLITLATAIGIKDVSLDEIMRYHALMRFQKYEVRQTMLKLDSRHEVLDMDPFESHIYNMVWAESGYISPKVGLLGGFAMMDALML